MERKYSIRRLSASLSFLFVLVLASSCTIYQNVPDDDGIYTSERPQRESRVYVQGSEEHEEYEENYFTKELERIDRINGTDIITDIENYSSYTDTIPTDTIVDIEPTGRAWGFNDSDDVVININLNNGWGWGPGWGWGGFYDPFWSPGFWGGWNRWGWGPGWGFGWGWNRWGWNRWGWNRWGWNNPYWGGGLAFGNRYYYGRRAGFNSAFNRRGSSITRRGLAYSSRNRNSNTVRRRSSSVYRNSNSSNTTTRRRSSTVRRNSNSNNSRSRVNSSTRRSNNSRSINRSSSRSRSSVNRSSSRSFRSSGSRGSSRGSSRSGGRRRG